MMHWNQQLHNLIDQYIGLEFMEGTGIPGTSGKLCGFDNEKIHIIEWRYTHFISTTYYYYQIRNIMPFPRCQNTTPPRRRPPHVTPY